jgi:hypothetical protein
MLITIAILVAALCGYGLGFRASGKHHRRAYAREIERRLDAAQRAEEELIAQGRDAAFDEIYEIAKQAQARQHTA